MKIIIVGSMSFHDKYLEIKEQLEKKAHKIIVPLPDEFYKKSKKVKRDSMEDFNKNLEESDAILVANYDKNGIRNYIGINSIMEIGIAFNRKKKIFILNKIPEGYHDELMAIGAIELNNNLNKIK